MSRLQSLTPVRRPFARYDRGNVGVGASAFVSSASMEEKPRPRIVRAARRPSERAIATIREQGRPFQQVKSRRRLRRKFRVLGCALMLIAPIAISMSLVRSAGPISPRDTRPGAASVPRPPSVSLMFEGSLPEPVVLPGYMLPDDGVEELLNHAGG